MNKNSSDVADVSVLPANEITAVDETEEANPAATRQQKLIKAGLLAMLAAIVVYVVLDYTVSIAYALSGMHSQRAVTCSPYEYRSSYLHSAHTGAPLCFLRASPTLLCVTADY